MTRESFDQACEVVAKECFNKLVPLGIIAFNDEQDREFIEAIRKAHQPLLDALWRVVEALKETHRTDELVTTELIQLGVQITPRITDANRNALANLTALLTQLTTQSKHE